MVVGLHPKAADFCRGRAAGLPVLFGAKFARACFPWPIGMCYGSRRASRMGGSARAARGVTGGSMSEGVSPSPRGTRPGFSVNTHNLIGGLIVTVLALLMLGYAFYVPNTVIPRFMVAALAVIGIATAVGLVPVHGPRDFYGGIALVFLGYAFYVPNAVIPGLMSAALVLVGIAAAVGLVPVHGTI